MKFLLRLGSKHFNNSTCIYMYRFWANFIMRHNLCLWYPWSEIVWNFRISTVFPTKNDAYKPNFIHENRSRILGQPKTFLRLLRRKKHVWLSHFINKIQLYFRRFLCYIFDAKHELVLNPVTNFYEGWKEIYIWETGRHWNWNTMLTETYSFEKCF